MRSENFVSLILMILSFSGCAFNENLGERQGHSASETTLCPRAASATSDGFGGGDGSRNNPYLICTTEQFKNIHGDMNSKRFFKLTQDLDFSSDRNVRIIAISPYATIDGANHTIRNITIEHGFGYKDNGLFGQLTKDINGNRDEVRNLTVENVKIIGDGSEDRAGVVAAANWHGIISNVHVVGTVLIDYPGSNPSTWSVGGLVGHNSSLIENSSFDGQVIGVYNVGGIAGINAGTIRNSTASGIVQGHQGVGGLIGVQLSSGKLENSIATAKVSGLDQVGTLIGLVCPGLSYSDCHF